MDYDATQNELHDKQSTKLTVSARWSIMWFVNLHPEISLRNNHSANYSKTIDWRQKRLLTAVIQIWSRQVKTCDTIRANFPSASSSQQPRKTKASTWVFLDHPITSSQRLFTFFLMTRCGNRAADQLKTHQHTLDASIIDFNCLDKYCSPTAVAIIFFLLLYSVRVLPRNA